MAIRPLFLWNPVANRCQFGGLVRVSLFRPPSCSTSFDGSAGVSRMSIWQLGSLGGLRHGCFRENDLTQSREVAKIVTQRIRRSGTQTRLISPSLNIAMIETLCFNIRHKATASPDCTGTRLAVGQAFQPDTSGCQAGKPDLLHSVVEPRAGSLRFCVFSSLRLCARISGFCWNPPQIVGIVRTPSVADHGLARLAGSVRRRADSVVNWTAGLPLPLEAGDLSVSSVARSGGLATTCREGARDSAPEKSALVRKSLRTCRFGMVLE